MTIKHSDPFVNLVLLTAELMAQQHGDQPMELELRDLIGQCEERLKQEESETTERDLAADLKTPQESKGAANDGQLTNPAAPAAPAPAETPAQPAAQQPPAGKIG